MPSVKPRPLSSVAAISPLLALALALGACPKEDARDGDGGASPSPTPTGTDLDDPEDPTPPASSCDGGGLTEIEIIDAWGRPLDGDLATAVLPTSDAELSELTGDCAPVAWLSCGQQISGDNSDPNGGATWIIDGYPISVGSYSGGEVAFAFRAPASEEVRWDLVNPHPSVINHDLFVLEGGGRCEASAAMARGFNGMSFDAERGATYFLLVDSFAGQEGPFQARLDCDGTPAEGAPSEPLPIGEEPEATADGPFSLDVSAADYFPTTLSATVVDGAFEDVSVTGAARWAISHDLRELPDSDEPCDVTTLYVGLDHRWFAADTARPPREGNQVDLMLSGQDLWASVYDDLLDAKESVHWATWWWESDFELIRGEGHWNLSEAEREPQTILSLLDGMPSVQKKVLVSRFCDDSCVGLLDGFTLDEELIARAEQPGDAFEMIQQGNPTDVPYYDEFEPEPIKWVLADRAAAQPDYAGRDFEGLGEDGGEARFDIPAASYHQKMHVIDGSVAYVLGMNTKATDWDTTAHEVFDARRMAFDATTEERWDVHEHRELPDLGPRKDYGVRIEGPCAADVDAILQRRWDYAISTDEPYSEGNSSWTPPSPAPALAGGLQAQFLVTMPAPLQERSILESLSKAVAAAEDYILVEDQYWRAPLLNEVILRTLQQKPKVKLVVITSTVSPADPAAEWTIRSDRLFREQVPGQYATYTTRSFDWRDATDDWFGPDVEPQLVPHSLHSKLMIVDDRYLSVGSANKNNRGMLFEGEADIAVLDAPWVREARDRILRNLLGPGFAPLLSDDFDETWDLLADAATWNQQTTDWWDENASSLSIEAARQAELTTWPSGFLYPWEPPGWSLLTPGPDAF